MQNKQKRVLIALGWYDYRLHRGIEKFAREHNWHLSANLTREKVIPWGWEGDGILAWLGAGDDLAKFVVSAKKPTVDFSCHRTQLRFHRVLEDHAHAAQLVAEHFLSRGFHNFLYYSDTDNWAYEERGQSFVKALKRFGHDCIWLRWHRSPVYRDDREQWRHKRQWLLAQLKSKPKPLAVFAADDEQAIDVLESCRERGSDGARRGGDHWGGKLSFGSGHHTHAHFKRGHQSGSPGLYRRILAAGFNEWQAPAQKTNPDSRDRHHYPQEQRSACHQSQRRGQQPPVHLGTCHRANNRQGSGERGRHVTAGITQGLP